MKSIMRQFWRFHLFKYFLDCSHRPQLVISGVTVDPLKKFSWRIGRSVRGNVSAEFGHYSNW